LTDYLESEQSLNEFLNAWEQQTLDPKKFTHAAHVAVCASYLHQQPPAEALERMRTGIFRFNAATGTPNTDTRGYHETLTRFWVDRIAEVPRSGSRIEFVRQAVALLGRESGLHRGYYSFDVVKSVQARREWVPPDRLPEDLVGSDPERG
jgi:hypothetical protein